ncbi:uncharacterized protein TM35_000361320 [Trypanosoma theileri]|uniref:Uncharacterized protein n=1 Tax=Trypanosoma theileri TaxID=67003 RepID=A0A1X0NKJ3_9TRYP|nr:uncharacterized protein TM35_000361320 [Trypanosoma theileri]ORC85272.1 hypothetical protein TM35_000361320 [Trypanosoma theileri]
MSYPLPKKYYLLVHDAIRKVLGTEAEISAFVKAKKLFQCDMLVNATATDPDLAEKSNQTNNKNNNNNINNNNRKRNKNNNESAYVREFAVGLQRYLGSCDVVVRRRRLDVVFLDREVLQIALGAPRRAINNLQSAEEINNEPAWVKRNRLRISLGFDEELFTNACDFKINVAARMMEKWAFDAQVMKGDSNIFHTEGNIQQQQQQQQQEEEELNQLREELPPVTYWQAHGYVLTREYHVEHHVALLGTISQNFAKYYGEFPFDNPYCPGEDLNTLASVQTLCKAWKQLPLEDWKSEYELQLGMGPPLGS